MYSTFVNVSHLQLTRKQYAEIMVKEMSTNGSKTMCDRNSNHENRLDIQVRFIKAIDSRKVYPTLSTLLRIWRLEEGKPNKPSTKNIQREFLSSLDSQDLQIDRIPLERDTVPLEQLPSLV